MKVQENSDFGKTIAAKVADQIRDDIICRKIEPGSRITVKEIADRYCVSSMPVREAFNMLCGEQLLEMSPYRGATVKAVTSDLVAQLLDVQIALEALLVELCLKRGYSDELLNQLEEINREIEGLQETEYDMKERRVALNVQFHKLAYSPCEDHMAYEMFERTLNQLHAIRKHHVVDIQRVKETVMEHKMFIRALRMNDTISAVTIIRIHSQNSKQYTLNNEKFEV